MTRVSERDRALLRMMQTAEQLANCARCRDDSEGWRILVAERLEQHREAIAAYDRVLEQTSVAVGDEVIEVGEALPVVKAGGDE